MPVIETTETPKTVLRSDFLDAVAEDAGAGDACDVEIASDGAIRVKAPVASHVLRIAVQANAAANLTLTNQASAAQFLGNSNRNITMADLDLYSECRLIARVVTASGSANTPKLVAKYLGSFSTTAGDYADLGASEVSVSLASTGLITSGWAALAAGAIDTVRYLAVIQQGGDGAADPALGPIHLEFR